MEKLVLTSAVILVILFIQGHYLTNARSATTPSAPENTYEFHPDYKVKFTTDADSVTINVVAKTSGYVGFGISKSGMMDGADIFIGGVGPQGSNYDGSYHATGHSPVKDSGNNWEFISAKEADGFTTVNFKRPFKSEKGQDIGPGEITVIWSIGGTDETSMQHIRKGQATVTIREKDSGSPINMVARNTNVTTTTKNETTKESNSGTSQLVMVNLIMIISFVICRFS